MEKKNSQLTYEEIYKQPQSFEAINASLDSIYKILDQVFSEEYDQLIFTGCGTSFYLAQAAAHAFSTYNDVPAKAVCCSELYYFPENFIKKGRVLVVPVTRKSYTTEVRLAIDKVKCFPGVKTLAVTCDENSASYNDFILLSPKAQEDSVIMTRSFTSMVYLTVIMALYAGGKREKIAAMADYKNSAKEMLGAMDELARRIIGEHEGLNLFIILGQGVYYGIANECMNKIKEMGIANSEAYVSLEYRHGPMSLVDENTMILLLCHSQTAKEDGRLLAQMKEYGAVCGAVGRHASSHRKEADYYLDLPLEYDDAQNAAMIGFMGQFLGYYIAERKGIDADCPRHLSQAIVIS